MNTAYLLLWLHEHGAVRWRVNLAARSVLAKIILSLPIGEMSLRIIALRDTL